MQAAIMYSSDSPPHFGTFADPVPQEGESTVMVTAAALSPLSRSQAAGTHYSSETIFPFIPGVDGVGRLRDGKRVYFAFPRPPYGALAERTAVHKTQTTDLPEDIDDITAAAIANPGMSSWAGLVERAHLAPGESVLINGATGVAGRLAIQIAKYLGAGSVIAAGRDPAVLETLPSLGADGIVCVDQPAEQLTQAFREAIHDARTNVILDYLWGASAGALIAAIAGHGAREGERRIRYVQAGSIAGPTAVLDASAFRSSGLEMMGTGLGSVSQKLLIKSIGGVFRAAATARFHIATEAIPLSDVESAWTRDTGGKRLVFTVTESAAPV
jgi:NADPH:quinone reductase-like Zn-dependent oxidoreductase